MSTRLAVCILFGGLCGVCLALASCGGGDDDDGGGGGSSPAPLVITTASLPAGTDGQPYTADIVATGGTGPYSWQITSGSLPGGLLLAGSTTLTETVAGTPNSTGTFNFTVEITDSASPPQVTSQPLSIIISPAGGNNIDGVAFKGPFTSGTVEAHAITASGNLGALLGTTTVLANGSFTINVGSHVDAVHLTLAGGSYEDEVTGTAAQLRPLTSVLPAAFGSPTANITPLTTMAATLARRRVGLGATAPAAIDQALMMLEAWFGVPDLLTTVPDDLSAGAATAGTPEAEYGALLAAISQQANGLGVGADALAEALAEDLGDEVFDGDNGGPVAISGGGNLSATAAQGELATALTDFLASAANQSGLAAGDFTDLIDRLQTNVDSVMFVTDIVVTPANLTVAQGMQVVYSAQGTFSDGTTGDVTGTVNWDSSNNGVATINAAGIATAGNTPASVTISAEQDNTVGDTTLTVGNFTLTSITVTPAAPQMNQAATQQFTATANYSNATNEDISDRVIWDSGTPSVLDLDATGFGTALAPGSSLVTATEPGTTVSGDTTVTVLVSYAADIQPIFNNNCISCHPPEQNLSLLSYANLMSGNSNFGPVVIPFDSGGSHIIDRLEGNGFAQMPYLQPPLPPATIQLVKDWIDQGALDN
jgi:trimeric autotransporter adhesin